MRVRTPLLVLAALALVSLVPSTAGAVPAHKLRCFGHQATHVGTAGDDWFQLRDYAGPSPPVVVGLGGSDRLEAPWSDADVDVYFCGGSGGDNATGTLEAMNGGGGRDGLFAQCLPRVIKSVERVRDEDC